MAEPRSAVHIPTRPAVLDHVRLHDIELPLPAAPDPWHRLDKPQPCTASLKLSYSSAIAAASADDVSLSLDYGKLFRRVVDDVRNIGHHAASPEHPHRWMVSVEGTQREEMKASALGQDPRVTGGIVANCGLGLLDETAAGVRRMSHVHSPRGSFSAGAAASQIPPATTYGIGGNSGGAGAGGGGGVTSHAIAADYGQCEIWLHLPKALIRADGGFHYRSVTVWGYRQRPDAFEAVDSSTRCPVVLEEEFRIDDIRCNCILGVNSHERVEKQAVIISLQFRGPGQLAWGSTVVETYQAMTRAVAEKVDETSFQTVEALATFVARIVTVEFGNERVTVRVEKPSALAFVQRSGIEITRSHAFFENHMVPRR